MRLYKQVSSDSFSILSNKPSGALGVETITIYGFDFAMYPLAYIPSILLAVLEERNQASSNSMKDTLGRPRIASK